MDFLESLLVSSTVRNFWARGNRLGNPLSRVRMKLITRNISGKFEKFLQFLRFRKLSRIHPGIDQGPSLDRSSNFRNFSFSLAAEHMENRVFTFCKFLGNSRSSRGSSAARRAVTRLTVYRAPQVAAEEVGSTSEVIRRVGRKRREREPDKR